jgi:hypothetical protein
MTRQQKRTLASLGVAVLGGWFTYLGNSWTVSGCPIWVLGVVFAGAGILGLCGVNVFAGGPLDVNNDPK